MKNILFVIDSCHKCQKAIEHLNSHQIPFELINALDFMKISEYKTYLKDQALPILLVAGEIVTYPDILELKNN